MPETDHHDVPAPETRRRARGPVARGLGLFSSVWFGVLLLLLLFVYSSIGSAGAPIGPGITRPPFLLRPDAWVSVRELIELSEFQWFNWWPFDVLIALTCLTLVVTTVRRIPFSVINLGVWMIHGGIVILALGSVWYFSTKVEGDAVVARRRIVAEVAGHDPVPLVAVPGARALVGAGDAAYAIEVTGITPEWELLSGPDAGRRVYKVSILVRTATRAFIRELIAGYPQHTEDLVRSADAAQPLARASKTLGTPLVDETLSLRLDYQPQEHFYLRESAAIYLREAGAREWIERPVRRLPRFKDHLSSLDRIWATPGEDPPPLRPIDVAVPAVHPDDPMPGVELRVTDALRYASLRTRRLPGGDRLDPAVMIRLGDERGRQQELEMRALDPEERSLGDGAIEFHWVANEDEVRALREIRPATLEVAVPAAGFRSTVPVTAPAGEDEQAPFTPIGDTAYAYRVQDLQDELVIDGRSFSLAVVDIRRGDEQFVRWVFDDPRLTRDLSSGGSTAEHEDHRALDEGIAMSYRPGQRRGIRIVAGPDETSLRLLLPVAGGAVVERPIVPGETVEVRRGITLTVDGYLPRSRTERRPLVVPVRQRDRDLGVQASMVRVEVPAGAGPESRWLRYHLYPFRGANEALPRFPHEPSVVHLPDGRDVEMLFSRDRRRLPARVVLEDFELDTHIGGYGGSSASVRNWTSIVRFAEADGAWSEPVAVSVNDPQERDGFWFFQSQWDPPAPSRGAGDPGSAGLNYTVLGVGNREGVFVQLLGSCLSVIGMLYAFYVKPMIKRRRHRRVYATAGADRPRGLRVDVPEGSR